MIFCENQEITFRKVDIGNKLHDIFVTRWRNLWTQFVDATHRPNSFATPLWFTLVSYNCVICCYCLLWNILEYKVHVWLNIWEENKTIFYFDRIVIFQIYWKLIIRLVIPRWHSVLLVSCCSRFSWGHLKYGSTQNLS